MPSCSGGKLCGGRRPCRVPVVHPAPERVQAHVTCGTDDAEPSSQLPGTQYMCDLPHVRPSKPACRRHPLATVCSTTRLSSMCIPKSASAFSCSDVRLSEGPAGYLAFAHGLMLPSKLVRGCKQACALLHVAVQKEACPAAAAVLSVSLSLHAAGHGGCRT